MEKKHKIKSTILNENFQCGICQGYIIDATTITECLHSFCKSCLMTFVDKIDHKCPTCNITLNSLTNCIKLDSALQRLIYRLVPGLLDNEIERREKFYLNEKINDDEFLLHKKTILNIKLVFKSSDKNQLNNSIKLNDKENSSNQNNNNINKQNINQFKNEKYIQCLAQTPINVLSKLIRNKYNIPFNYKIKMSHNGYKLNEDETLLQVFTCFLMNKNELFNIDYEFSKIKLKSIENVNEKCEQVEVNNHDLKNTSNVKQNRHKLVNNDFLKLRLKKKTKTDNNNNNINKKLVQIAPKKIDENLVQKAFNKINEQNDLNSKKNDEKNLIEINYTINTNTNNDELIEQSNDHPLDLTINK